ncbi:sensor histidine kinase [Methylotenera sp.]|uniref:sensor histidine kinase n=1 Tax=Methylotenera sp. TaxID=2051956 RepID=UPI0027317ADE|nr:histidine kinase [Methylotenera sp.]MDP2229419.1 histidine kinase [Methylotenera sp.]
MRKSSRLPNMRNLGVNLRILVIVNAALALAAMLLSSSLIDFSILITSISAIAQPMLLTCLLLLYVSYPLLVKISYRQGITAILLIILFTCSSVYWLISQLMIFNNLPSSSRTLFYVFIVSVITLYYFNLQQRAYSPAIDEARLQALQARIRPHFLFNCINAVLSLIRSQPKQAEAALEDMADLFRVLMADNRDLVPLAQEIALCRQYLALEKLRLDERLIIEWKIDDMPPDALIPPLLLQPLIENAVYHGIEPLASGGKITIQIYTKRNEIHLILSNPYSVKSTRHIGNQMALKNIKERLTLHFDLEASLKSSLSNGEYQVHITLPHTTK